jgi:hypothetical protein
VTAVQSLEDGNTVVPDHHGLTVDCERPGTQFVGRGSDRRISLGPVMAARVIMRRTPRSRRGFFVSL